MAARGLDIPHVTHVINYDLPTDIDDYVHRYVGVYVVGGCVVGVGVVGGCVVSVGVGVACII